VNVLRRLRVASRWDMN